MTIHNSPTAAPERFRLPPERHSLTHRFQIADFKAYLTVGFYEDGRIGEIFIEAEKQGSTLRGLLASFGRCISIGLQHGIPLDHYAQSFKYMRFTPEGFTRNQDVGYASSIMDYIFKYLQSKLKDGYLDNLRPQQEQIAEDVCSPTVEGEERSTEKGQDKSDLPGDDSSNTSYPKTKTPAAATGQAEIAISCKSDS